MIRTSLRFFGDAPVRAVWQDADSTWWFCAVDVVRALTQSANPRVYWAQLKRRHPQLLTNCKQLKLTAQDGKRYLTDVLDHAGVLTLVALLPAKNRPDFVRWLSGVGNTVDERSKRNAYALFESGAIEQIEVGTVRGLQQIHAYLFGGLFDFAGKIRGLNIAKGGFAFVPVLFLRQALATVEQMPEDTLAQIVQKYVEMNVAHPFMEGNGRSTRIWLDLILKKNLHCCVDWSRIDKYAYLDAMRKSPVDPSAIHRLIEGALTDRTDDRELFLKGIDYSYYYEQE